MVIDTQPFMEVQVWIGGTQIVNEAMRVPTEEVEPGVFKGRTNPEAVLKFMEETTYALLQRLGEMVTENKETESP
jgi:tRNA pseudouridine-54 N-methylase